MKTPFALTALCAGLLFLSACNKTPDPPATPMANAPATTESGATAGSVPSSPVPSAESVFPAGSAVKAESPPSRMNRSMSAAQESTSMPMPGQNNDHSVPVVPASAPARRSSP